MSPSVVSHAVRQGRQSVTVAVVVVVATVTGPNGRCSRWYVPSVAKIPRYRLNPVKVDQSTAATATIRLD